ncbi:MAG: glycine cleavage system aminomethyltransferase GcvT [Bacteroidales bacterium]|nr:glycine cleavage system aminomethyltransferase GcvT [Bacteroidales bacterium]
MKRTVFYPKHLEWNARMIEFAGFEMPLEYAGITAEHLNVRNAVGVFDVSHMGEFWVKGPNAFTLLQKVTTNDISALSPGKAQYTCFPNGKGGIVDDLIIYQYEKEKYLLVVNAANIEKDWSWINAQNSPGAELENASDKISQLAVQGPFAAKVLQPLTDTNLFTIQPFTFVTGSIAGVSNIIIAATGYTGAGGFELYIHNYDALPVWDAVFSAGKEYGIRPVGLAARDTLRLEMGYCLYGNDIDDTTSPIEAGLGWITKFTEGKHFIDRECLLEQKKKGVTRKLIGFEMVDRGIPRHLYPITDENGSPIGEVTSGTMAPSLKVGIGMGYVKTAYAQAGTVLHINIRDKLLKARVVKMPFYKSS